MEFQCPRAVSVGRWSGWQGIIGENNLGSPGQHETGGHQHLAQPGETRGGWESWPRLGVLGSGPDRQPFEGPDVHWAQGAWQAQASPEPQTLVPAQWHGGFFRGREGGLGGNKGSVDCGLPLLSAPPERVGGSLEAIKVGSSLRAWTCLRPSPCSGPSAHHSPPLSPPLPFAPRTTWGLSA